MNSNDSIQEFHRSEDSLLPELHFDVLSKREEAFLTNLGIGGMLLSVACFVQILLLIRAMNWYVAGALTVFILQSTAYVMMMRKSQWGPVFLLIGTFLSLLLEVLLVEDMTFSLALLLLVIYSIITVSLTYGIALPQKLKMKSANEKEEQMRWQQMYNKRK